MAASEECGFGEYAQCMGRFVAVTINLRRMVKPNKKAALMLRDQMQTVFADCAARRNPPLPCRLRNCT